MQEGASWIAVSQESQKRQRQGRRNAYANNPRLGGEERVKD
jgi:hypothetical protein